jgi:hypothetical protein
MFTQGFVEEGAKFIALFWPAIVNQQSSLVHPKEWMVNGQAIIFNWVSVL